MCGLRNFDPSSIYWLKSLFIFHSHYASKNRLKYQNHRHSHTTMEQKVLRMGYRVIFTALIVQGAFI